MKPRIQDGRYDPVELDDYLTGAIREGKGVHRIARELDVEVHRAIHITGLGRQAIAIAAQMARSGK